MIPRLKLAVLMPAVLPIDFLTGFDLRTPNVRAEVMQLLKMHQIQVVFPHDNVFPNDANQFWENEERRSQKKMAGCNVFFEFHSGDHLLDATHRWLFCF